MYKMPLFDTHAHYDHPRFEQKGPQLVKTLIENRVLNGVVIPAITYESNYNRKNFPEHEFPTVYFAAGLHPKHAANRSVWTDVEKAEFETHFLIDKRTVAVKTGLDFSIQLSEQQKIRQVCYFEDLIDLANKHSLPLVLHIRASAETAVEILKEKPLTVEAVVHCFTYDYATAKELMSVGVTRFGIGGMLTRDGMDSLRECVQKLTLTSLLLETDAPFVKPKGFMDYANTSESLVTTANLIADLKGLDARASMGVLQSNAYDFYRLNQEFPECEG